MEKEDKEYSLYVMHIIGNSGTGKTSIMNRASKDVFEERHIQTIGIDFVWKSYIIFYCKEFNYFNLNNSKGQSIKLDN